jgi:tungstate transport system ATP-binding protein
LTVAASIYDIRSLRHLYDEKPVLTVDRLTIPKGAIVGLVGPNGSGKSTLLRLLGLIERPSRGTIQFNGQTIAPFSENARHRITLLPQEPVLMKRSVLSNVVYGLKLRGERRGGADRAGAALAMVGFTDHAVGRRPWYALSGGESQRVALAARLILQPKVLLLDEPTASVDAASAQLIKEASLKAQVQWDTTLIIASHDWQWLYEICDTVLHMFRGRIFGSGTETVAFGPWLQTAGEEWGKTLSDDQVLRVPRPPRAEAAALIDDFSFISQRTGPTPGQVVLTGTVSRLTLEKTTGRVLVTVMAGNLGFTRVLDRGQLQAQSMWPGVRLFVAYRLDRIHWL